MGNKRNVYINVTNKFNMLWKWVNAKWKFLVYVLQLCSEQQESRPLLSPSIDDFQSESKSDASTRPVTSNTAGFPIITALSSVPPLLLTHLLFFSYSISNWCSCSLAFTLCLNESFKLKTVIFLGISFSLFMIENCILPKNRRFWRNVFVPINVFFG